MDNDAPPSFWDVDQYRRVIKRIENGYKSCDNFLTMVQERAEIEVRYAKSVRKWNEKWSGLLDKGSEHGSTLEAWRACLQEGSIVAQVHEDCKMKIMGEDGPFYNMYKWKKEHYHKGSFGSLQEAREANDGFAAAQKEYARLLTKSQRAKKAYHSACVSAHKAHLFAQEETHEESVRPEFRRKLQQRAAKLASHQEKVKQLYLKRVMKCSGPAKDRYVQDMTGEITKWQSLERARLDTVHGQLILFVRSLDCGSPYKASGFEHLEDLYRRLEESISHADSLRDVQDWDSRFGTGCEQHWPRFEEMDIEDLDAAAYADVERKTSFGKAIMQRRRQRSHHRRSQQTIYSSDFDEEDDFSSDSFDSTSTDAESVIHDQEPLRPDHNYHGQDTSHMPQHNQVLPSPYPPVHQVTQYHQPQSSQPYGHHVADVPKQYGSQGHQHTSYPVNQVTSRRSSHHVAQKPNDVYAVRSERSDHKSTGHHRRSKHSQVNPRHDQPRHHDQTQHDLDSTAYHATEWHTSHAWQHVPSHIPHDIKRESNTPPTRDVEIPAQNLPPHTNITTGGNYIPKIGEQVLSPRDHSGTSTVQGYQHVQVPPQSTQYPANHQGTGGSYYGTQHLTAVTSPQTVTPQTQVNYVPSYQHVTPGGTQVTATQSWRQLQTTGVAGVNATNQSPSTVAWHQQTTTSSTPQSGRSVTSTSSSRHERHTTLDQAKRLLHQEDGETIVRALYDFKSSTRDELPLKRGEVLVQTGKHSENGWAFGRNLEKTGIFPASYVQIVR